MVVEKLNQGDKTESGAVKIGTALDVALKEDNGNLAIEGDPRVQQV